MLTVSEVSVHTGIGITQNAKHIGIIVLRISVDSGNPATLAE